MTLCRDTKTGKMNHGLPLLVALLFVQAASLYAGKAPNILYIFTDDQSYRTVSCYPRSYDFADTPNIDRLAEQGIRFDLAYIGAKCAPSRAMQSTGRQQFYIRTLPEEEWKPEWNKGVEKFWFETMREAGYYTGMTGKWHWGEKRPLDNWDWSAIWDRSVEGSGYYEGTYVSYNGEKSVPLGGYSTDRYTDLTVKFIEKRAENPDQPWFFWLCYGAVHAPYTQADRHKGMLFDAPAPPIPADIYGPRPGKPTHFQDSKWRPQEPDDKRWWDRESVDEERRMYMGDEPDPRGQPLHRRRTHEYFVKKQTEAVAAIDEGVGRIIEALAKTGQLENTILVFTSDQGYVWGHHGLKGKIDPYDAAIRPPLIVSYPKKFAKGSVCKSPVNGPDLVRSFHSWSGVEPDTILTGRDMTPLVMEPESKAVFEEWNRIPTLMTYVKNRYDPYEMGRRLKREQWNRCTYGDSYRLNDEQKKKKGPSGIPLKASPWYFMIHDGTYKYTRYANPDRIEELYNLESDPDELVNLAVKPAYKEILLEMREACRQEIIRSGGAPFADHLPIPRMAY